MQREKEDVLIYIKMSDNSTIVTGSWASNLGSQPPTTPSQLLPFSLNSGPHDDPCNTSECANWK